MSFHTDPISALIEQARAGDGASFEALVEDLYRELRTIAHGQRRRLRASDTMHTTALVHEAYLKLHPGEGMPPRTFVDRGHFFRVASRVMHDVLIDYARAAHAQKRGGDTQDLPLSQFGDRLPAAGLDLATVISVDDGMRQLRTFDAEAAQVVQLRYFGGLTNEETAEAMSLSTSTVKRRWLSARAYLLALFAERPTPALIPHL